MGKVVKYIKNEIYNKAIQIITDYKLFVISDVIAYLPCGRNTFYDLIPPGSNEHNHLLELIENNKIEIKVALRQKWFKSENATLQMGLMKLICTDEERRKLATNYNENQSLDENGNPTKEATFVIQINEAKTEK